VIAPEEVAELVLELASAAGAHRNGEAIVLDGYENKATENTEVTEN
jgi:hypothetical protein